MSPCDGSPKKEVSNRCDGDSWMLPLAEYDSELRLRSMLPSAFSGNAAPGGATNARLSHEGSIAPKKNTWFLTIAPPPSAPKSLVCEPTVLIEPAMALYRFQFDSREPGRA